MIRRFHEAPKSIFKEVQRVTDGDYALVNLFAEDPEYYQLFKHAVESGREVILDNGVFELGSAWDAAEYANWINRLKPTWYIVPDVLEDADATIHSFYDFIGRYEGLPGKVIGVVQGKSYEDMVRCYEAIEPSCDMVAMSFDFSWFQDPDCPRSFYLQAMIGRQAMIATLLEDHVINTSKPHHLLGVMLPQEVRFYAQPKYDWIYSIDTSNPVVHGLKGIRYTGLGLRSKEYQKLYTMINAEVSSKQLEDILFNIEQFKEYCNGY